MIKQLEGMRLLLKGNLMSREITKQLNLKSLTKKRTALGHELYILQLKAQKHRDCEQTYETIFKGIENTALRLEAIENSILEYKPLTHQESLINIELLLDILVRAENIDDDDIYLRAIRERLSKI